MTKFNSDNLSKGDFISFIAILLLGVTLFFGMNFATLGNKVPSIIVAILFVVLMLVFVFFAAFAKAQNRNQSMWKAIEYSMLGLYIVALIPSYLYSAKFFDIYFNKAEITDNVNSELEAINGMFRDYNRKCESRCSSYQTALEAMLTYEQGRQKIAELLDIKPDEVSQATVRQASDSFISLLRSGEFKSLESEKNMLFKNVQSNFKSWNILFIPQYASELSDAKVRYANQLENIYNKHKNDIEKNIPEFDASSYHSTNSIKNTFSDFVGFSVMGLLAVIFLGGLGLAKYLFGEKRTVIPFSQGSADVITEDGGGYTF